MGRDSRRFRFAGACADRGRRLTRRWSRTDATVALLPLASAAERQYRSADVMTLNRGRRHGGLGGSPPLTQSCAVLGLALVCMAQVGCSTKECTLIGCGPRFEVRFMPAAGKWSAGTYTVAVTADGTAGSCVATLPFPSCQVAPECTGSRDWYLLDSGCALAPDQHGISGLVFGMSTPANVAVVVTRDGQQLADGVFTPTYESSQPNGPGCGDTCFGAMAGVMAIQP
jgi:hypothetical protein